MHYRQQNWTFMRRDERASIMPIMALLIFLALAGGALAVDLARAYSLRGQLQLTADAAALAAAINLPDVEAARIAAQHYAARNGEHHQHILNADDIEIGHWDASTQSIEATDDEPSSVRVTLRLAAGDGNGASTIFAKVFGVHSMDFSVHATAGRGTAPCSVALDTTKARAMTVDGDALLEAEGCTVQVNSSAEDALWTGGNSSILATSICVVGDAAVGGGTSIIPSPTPGCPPVIDPLIDLSSPGVGTCASGDDDDDDDDGGGDDENGGVMIIDQTTAINPGLYCGGLSILGSSNVTLHAGTYIIENGPFVVDSEAVVTGDGVTIFLTGNNGTLDFKGNASLSLRAPSDGQLGGILFFQDRNFGGTHKWQSDEPSSLVGTIYLPGGDLVVDSPSSMTPANSCSVLIANSLSFLGNGGASIDLTSAACRSFLPAAVLGRITLLE